MQDERMNRMIEGNNILNRHPCYPTIPLIVVQTFSFRERRGQEYILPFFLQLVFINCIIRAGGCGGL